MKKQKQEDVGMKNRLLKRTAEFALTAVTSLLLFVLVAFAAGPSSPQPGTYAMSITAKDSLPNVPAEVRSRFDGKWQLTLAEGNKYQISKDGEIVVEGRFTLVKEQLTLTDEKGVLACTQPPGMETGTYKWISRQKELIFTKVEDECEGRISVLTLHSWLKVK